MLLGIIAVSLAFIFAVISAGSYFINARKDSNNLLDIARKSYYVMTGLIVFSTIYLFYLIMTQQFQVSYVYQYSSRDMTEFYRFSSFWGGQEGTFLLWATYTSILGLFLLRTVGSRLESWAMFFIVAVELFLLAILVKKSPFEVLEVMPPDGVGLNPLLQDPWMVVHPPTLFVGFSSLIIPFALALAALCKNEYGEWARRAFPWVIFGSLTLGAGNILGGYWAYKVLGWGGYWGWDPVENSAFIPWAITLGLLHGVIVQKSRGGFQKTNLALAIFAYLLVIYGSFLTRSGVLGDFSVHSFSSLGVNNYLIAFLLIFVVTGIGLFIKRYNEIPGKPISNEVVSKDVGLAWSVILLLSSGILTLIGASSPLITKLPFFREPANVSIDYYATVNFPIGVLIALLIGIVPFVFWKSHDLSDLFKRIILPLGLALISSIVAFIFGVRDAKWITFFFLSAFALWSNLFWFLKYKANPGSALTHMGVGLMFIGIITSSFYGVSKRVGLPKDEAIEVMGYHYKYKGIEHVADGKNRMIIEVSNGKENFVAAPRLYFSEYNQGWMKNPHIQRFASGDLYISPVEQMNSEADAHEGLGNIILKKGENQQIGDYNIKFINFVIPEHMAQGGPMQVGAKLEITKGYKKYELVPVMKIENGERIKEKVDIPESTGSITLEALNADMGAVSLNIAGIVKNVSNESTSKETLIIEVSTKPFINVLWIGTVILLVGQIVAIRKRMKEIPKE
jgi:cytochrome c-type biogenesis protein CcmF